MNRECLVGRSKCYLRLQNTDEALKDAEAALQIEKNSHQAIFQKAEALFCRGDYEHALVYYSRGAKLRKDLDCFRLGIQKSQDAITAAVGANGNASKLTPTKDADCRVRIKKGKQKKTHR
ncbi:unnamed protein product [Notodromas monacha]|uniref:Outer dynein arm-docking complex subunit 4 n=1 Tax=Notodromas monacha TaxID=399045 RepID=A0A7R9BE09_9CRUS|nr:unnamed protein product [Notodromas monacha]CAG0913614.1 unnamed protein product [Notodromas monacha]